MTFPVIRPEDAASMTAATRQLLLRQLRVECREAAARNRQILTERRARKMEERAAERAAERERRAAARAGLTYTEEERDAGERVLAARRLLVREGLHPGDGTRADDLKAAHSAIGAGSTNGYLRELDREYWRNRSAAQRAVHQAHAAHRLARNAS